jgi:hypothetical protein
MYRYSTFERNNSLNQNHLRFSGKQPKDKKTKVENKSISPRRKKFSSYAFVCVSAGKGGGFFWLVFTLLCINLTVNTRV